MLVVNLQTFSRVVHDYFHYVLKYVFFLFFWRHRINMFTGNIYIEGTSFLLKVCSYIIPFIYNRSIIITGHLVVSTIHAKDGVGSLYRLLDLGITTEELRQTIIGIVTQRLVVASVGLESELSAVFEILSDELLEEAFQSMVTGKAYRIPYTLSLSYQIERGVREGVIEKS